MTLERQRRAAPDPRALGGLDTATEHDQWAVKVYPDAHDGHVLRRPGPKKRRKGRTTGSAAKNAADSKRRSQRRAQRYAVSNDLALLVTCTFEIAVCQREAKRQLDNFVRRIRRNRVYPVPFPWMATIESHSAVASGEHVHLLLPAADEQAIAQHWRLGFTTARRASGTVETRRLGTYLVKEFGTPGSSRRLYRSNGFNPEPMTASAATMDEAVERANECMGRPVSEVTEWHSPIAGAGLWWE